MARLSDDLIAQLKIGVSLVRLVESAGITLKKTGKDYLGHCPFHDDKTPSFVISPDSNLWHCLGACGCGGSVIDFVMKREGVSFRHAVELLQNDAFLSLAAQTQPVKRASTPKLDSPLAADVDDAALLLQVIGFYHDSLKQSPEALAYLDSRGLNDAELIEVFKLGYANRTLGYRLPQKNRKEGAALRGRLQALGLLRESGHEHFNGSLVIPVLDDHGQVLEIYGRKLLDNLRQGTAKHLYLPGPHAGVFNPSSFSCPEVILCEALIDALTFWRHGFRHVTASYGINGFTEELLAAFRQGPVKRVLIAYDRDDAGNQAADKVAQRLLAEGIDCYRVLFPKGMDANEYALKMTPARKSLELVIRKAEWLGKGADPRLSVEPEPSAIASSLAAEPPLAAVSTLPASPQPEVKTPVIDATVNDNEILFDFANRRYRVRGFHKASSYDVLKINLLATNEDGMHVDNLDLYHAKHRYSFIKQAAIELGVTDQVIKQDLGKVLLKLEALQEEQIQAAIQTKDKTVALTHEEQQAALALLTAPDLLDRILADFNRAGVVGEEANKLMGYLATVSRKLDNPLAVIIQSTSAAGKSSLMNAVLAMVPEEERVHYSAMTGQSLFYMGETNLKHKILAIAEEEGAENASYALKLLQSEGELTMASTGKDETTGNLVTREYRVEGPVMLFLTTTAIDIDDELLNRCVVLTVNESREQTQLIHQMQRQKRTLAGLKSKVQKQAVLDLHRNAQRLLKPLVVVNPFADELTFLSDKTRTRRDHEKYLALIDAVALLHQYQRPINTEIIDGKAIAYIDVTLADIDTANRLAHDVLGKTFDELPPQTRTLLKQIKAMVERDCQAQRIACADYRFSRRMIRAFTGWSDGQLKIHCSRLEQMEYLLIHRGRRGQSLQYELLFDGSMDDSAAHLMGLINVKQLKEKGYDAKKSGLKPEKSAPSQGQVSPKSGLSQGSENAENAINTESNDDQRKLNGKTHSAMENSAASYRSVITPGAQREGL
jgi:DNA primase catalytic core